MKNKEGWKNVISRWWFWWRYDWCKRCCPIQL